MSDKPKKKLTLQEKIKRNREKQRKAKAKEVETKKIVAAPPPIHAVHAEIIPANTKAIKKKKLVVPKGAKTSRQVKEEKEGVSVGRKNIAKVGNVKVTDMTKKPKKAQKGENLTITSYFKPKKNGGKKKKY